ncbi:hypothetical protein BDB01DRAFT_807616 [Pilobolus umbonatus]|nr:hypothetical protein BDB01DRAFT_807616 [Pilobolus umbonatus]
MPECTRNDYIFSICIEPQQVTAGRLHEKDERYQDYSKKLEFGTSCAIDNHLKLLEFGRSDDLIQHEWDTTADNKCVFYYPCIVKAFYDDISRSKEDTSVKPAFGVYMKKVLRKYCETVDSVSRECIHWIITVPDSWGMKHIDTLRSILKSVKFLILDEILIINQSNALIRQLQSSQYTYSFINGEYYIVCYVDKYYTRTVCYGFEIGPPIKGLKNISRHTTKEIIRKDYMKDYIFNELCNKDLSEAKLYLSKANLYMKKLYEGACDLWFYNGESKKDEEEKFLLTRKNMLCDEICKSSTLTIKDVILNEKEISKKRSTIINKIIKLSENHHNVKVIVMHHTWFECEKEIDILINQLPAKFAPKSHFMEWRNLTDVFTEGAGQIMQDHLRIINYLPKITNEKALNSFTTRKTLFININWNTNSLLFSDPKKQVILVDDASTVIPHSYSLDQCFVIHHPIHNSNIKDINITEGFIDMKKAADFMGSKRKRISKFFNDNINKYVGTKPVVSVSQLEETTISSRVIHHLPQYKKRIPKKDRKILIILYFQCLQHVVTHYLMRHKMIHNESTLNCYISVDQRILDLFCIDYEELRSELLNTSSDYRLLPVKLIYSEQISAVHWKDQIKCHEIVEEYLDYPQYMVQVQLNHTNINLALNVILSLNQDIKSTKDETVLTLKRKLIPFEMVDMIAELLWTHIQTMDKCPIATCSKHNALDYEDDPQMYAEFMEHFKIFFIEKFNICNDQGLIEWYKILHLKMNSRCDCTYDMSPMDLFDVCINPTVDHVTSIVYASITDKCQFGEDKVTHIALMGTLIELKSCTQTYNQLEERLMSAIQYQQKYHNQITIHWGNETMPNIIYSGIKSIINTPSGGLLEQVYSGKYMIDNKYFSYFDYQQEQELHFIRENIMVRYGTRITESMRVNGFSKSIYSGNTTNSIQIRFLHHGGTYGSDNQLDKHNFIIGPSHYPLLITLIPGIHEITINYHEFDKDLQEIRKIKGYSISENIVLAPYV